MNRGRAQALPQKERKKMFGNKDITMMFYHIAGGEDWIQLNGKTVKLHGNDLYRFKWYMIQDGAVREFIIDKDKDVQEFIHY